METLENVFQLLIKVHMLKKYSNETFHIKAKVKAAPARNLGQVHLHSLHLVQTRLWLQSLSSDDPASLGLRLVSPADHTGPGVYTL